MGEVTRSDGESQDRVDRARRGGNGAVVWVGMGPATLKTSGSPQAEFAREQLIFLLQLAYSGELGALLAYIGHRHSLRDRKDRAEVGKIARDEIHHRHCILRMLTELGSAPEARRERKMARVGWAISVFCHVGGWFFPMYGAGKLEAQNIREYEDAARLALIAELTAYVDPLLEMAEVEWDHELYFRSRASSHPLWRVVPKWPTPDLRVAIRQSFSEFASSSDRTVIAVRAPWLIR